MLVCVCVWFVCVFHIHIFFWFDCDNKVVEFQNCLFEIFSVFVFTSCSRGRITGNGHQLLGGCPGRLSVSVDGIGCRSADVRRSGILPQFGTSSQGEICVSYFCTLLVFNFILVVLFFLGRLCPSRRDGTPLPARALCPVSNGSGGRLHFRRPDALLAHVVQFHFGRLVCFGPGRR